ncbi:hypothetical protein OROHE_015162 [Orobanche hederae]
MEPKIYALNNTTPDMKNWTAQVCVVNKTSPRTSSQSTPIKFQKLLLADEQGRLTDLIGVATSCTCICSDDFRFFSLFILIGK